MMLLTLGLSAGGIAAIVVAVVLLVLLAIIFSLLPIRIWFRALVSGVKIPMTKLIGMKWRGIKVIPLVDAYISAKKAGLDISIDELESHVLARGDVIKVVNALISAHSANMELAAETASYRPCRQRRAQRSQSVCQPQSYRDSGNIRHCKRRY